MAEPTVTRAELRAEICRRLGMRFHSASTPGYQTIGSVPTATTILDPTFAKQPDDFWNLSWFYDRNLDEARLIADFDKTINAYYLEYAFAGTPVAGHDYEVLDVWSPADVHQAINDALKSAKPNFFDTVEEAVFCLCREIVDYDTWATARFSKTPYIITDLAVEIPGAGTLRDKVASATTSVVTLQAADLSGIGNPTQWYISVYTGDINSRLGTVRQVSAMNPATKEVTVAPIYASPALEPIADQEVMLWDGSRQRRWYPMIAADFDTEQYPSLIRLLTKYQDVFPGHRVRARYVAMPEAMTTDADETQVPSDFIVPKALSYLYGLKKDDVRFDRAVFNSRANDLSIDAEQIRAAQAFRLPSMTLWQEEDEAIAERRVHDPQGNPLDW